MLSELQLVEVDPAGRASPPRTKAQLINWREGDPRNELLFRQVTMALGRGLSRRMSRALSIDRTEGATVLRAEGTFGAPLRGNWTLQFGGDGVVRSASFTVEGARRPLLESHSDGRTGTVVYHLPDFDFQVAVELRQASTTLDAELVARVERALAAPPAGADVIDHP
jgi:hypothetical protein